MSEEEGGIKQQIGLVISHAMCTGYIDNYIHYQLGPIIAGLKFIILFISCNTNFQQVLDMCYLCWSVEYVLHSCLAVSSTSTNWQVLYELVSNHIILNMRNRMGYYKCWDSIPYKQTVAQPSCCHS